MKRAFTVGRYQPFHLGHLRCIELIAKQASHLTIGLGSSQESRTKNNPFTAEERTMMIKKSLNLPIEYNIVPIPDMNDDKLWIAKVTELCPEIDVVYTNARLELKLFKGAGYEVVKLPFFNRGMYEGTEIRRRIFAGEPWQNLLPKGSLEVFRKIGGEKIIRETNGI